MSNTSKKVTVRMYNVGFGDSFLIRIPAAGGDRKILVDCGSIKKGDGGSIDDIVEAIVGDVKDKDGTPRIDVVIATHRHRDHVSGFASPAWADVEVKEVWMPWTENPKDPQARKIRDAQSHLALALHASLVAVGAAPELISVAENALVNEDAMTTLHEGFAGKPERRFLPPRDREARTFSVECLPNVLVHAMGPSFDEAVIADMDPPAGKSFLELYNAAEPGRQPTRLPFPGDWTLDVPPSELMLDDADRKLVESVGDGSEELLAAALDGAVNGTSLVIMFRVGQSFLLFPGDAQWGTWNMILSDPEWRNLLAKTTLLKVGHHGSHNATPRPFLDDVLPMPIAQFWAMVSTIQRGSWPIPKKELMAALEERTKNVVRSDEIASAVKTVFKSKASLSVEASLPI